MNAAAAALAANPELAAAAAVGRTPGLAAVGHKLYSAIRHAHAARSRTCSSGPAAAVTEHNLALLALAVVNGRGAAATDVDGSPVDTLTQLVHLAETAGCPVV